jgi:phosphoserine phosphatase RsbU/P
MTALIAVVYSKNGWRRSFRRRQTRFVDCTYRSVSSRNPRGTNSDNLRSTRNNSTVNRRVPSHLRLHVEDSSSHRTSIHSKFQSQDEIAACLQAFAQATGWGVRSTSNKQIRQADENGDAVPSKSPSFKSGFRLDEEKSKATPRRNADSSNEDSDGSASVPRWKLVDAAPMDGILSANDLQHFPTVTLENAEMLMATIERLVDRLEKTEAALRRQEAELATNVSVSRSPNEQEELADRLQSIIASSGKSIGSSAAAIYLLDDTTSSLKLRSAWGLPAYKLTEPSRELRGSLPDLEALLGNAVLLENIQAMPEWPSPEDFASAIVVPIGSQTMPHGTIWFWSDTTRKHSAVEIEIANLAAGRVMSELEHSLLGSEAKVAKQLRKQLDDAGNAQAARLPDLQPVHADFDISGWTFQDGGLGGGFHQWDLTPQEMIVAAVGSATSKGPQGALVSTCVQSSIKTLWPNQHSPSQIVRSAGDVLWGVDDADWTASSALFQLNPETGHGSVCLAGHVQAFIVSQRGFRPIGTPAPKLACQPDAVYSNQRFVLQAGEVLLAFSDTVIHEINLLEPKQRRDKRSQCKALNQNEILQGVRRLIAEPASEIAAHLARMLPSLATSSRTGDRSLIVLKNLRKS